MKSSRFLMLIAFLFAQISLQAQTAGEVFEKSWIGASKARTDVSESGYFLCSESLYNIEFNEEDNTFTGNTRTEFKTDIGTYVNIVKIYGEFDPDDFSVVITSGASIREDELPYGLTWLSTTLNLKLYSDSEHTGYYILSGQSTRMEYSDEFYEITTYPY